MNNLSQAAIAEQLQSLVTAAHQFACSLDIGDERIEAFELYEALRRLQRRGAAGEMLSATNPPLCPGIPDDAEWVDFGEDEDDE
ncbi:hypothetical protein [Cedecea sp. NFIX57]|uniref:hypothetical protein n=1 Tax=Cedecea sp. NFIX57 TaxID=1566286 RepID=UPI000A0D5B48|nr:hypothetical protein [Cedecea sp. NFIX57]SMG60179.1 hypothetical protein SAMN03159353_103425 [Cedecea sp. NFIX57]